MLSHGTACKTDINLGPVQEIIEEELAICRQLLDFTEKKKSALDNGNIDALLQINKEESTLVLRLKLLQEARLSWTGSSCTCATGCGSELTEIIQKEDVIRYEKTLLELKNIARKLRNIFLKTARMGNSKLGYITYPPDILDALAKINKI